MASTYEHRKLLALLGTQANQLDRLYARKSREIAQILKKYRGKSKSNVWKGNNQLERELDKALEGLSSDIKYFILQNAEAGQKMANDAYDRTVSSYIRGMDIDAGLKAGFFVRNEEALQGFLKARINGLDISRRVWNPAEQTKEQIESFIKSGLAEGRPATELATDLKKYLKEPNRRFRRLRDENTGKLVLSEPAKAYHPGRGVYRSSYQNALRLSRNEINIAYRAADHLRRIELDFVVGFRVNLSNAHPRYDICDELQGVYPKNFYFIGWHPNCLCFTTSILLKPEDFINSLNSGKFDLRRQIRSIPKRATDYLNANSEQIKGWSNKPYFIADNFKNTKDGFALKSHVTKP